METATKLKQKRKSLERLLTKIVCSISVGLTQGDTDPEKKERVQGFVADINVQLKERHKMLDQVKNNKKVRERYRKVMFVEEKKVNRRIKSIKGAMSSLVEQWKAAEAERVKLAKSEDAEEGDESNTPEQVAEIEVIVKHQEELRTELRAKDADLQGFIKMSHYVKYFPDGEPYVPLFPAKETPALVTRRDEISANIQARLGSK